MPNIYEIIKFDVSSVALDIHATFGCNDCPPSPPFRQLPCHKCSHGVNDDFDVQLTDW